MLSFKVHYGLINGCVCPGVMYCRCFRLEDKIMVSGKEVKCTLSKYILYQLH